MDENFNNKPESSRKRTILSAIFMILFGLILGILSIATLIGPVIGLLIVALGLYLIWKSTQTDTPM